MTANIPDNVRDSIIHFMLDRYDAILPRKNNGTPYPTLDVTAELISEVWETIPEDERQAIAQKDETIHVGAAVATAIGELNRAINNTPSTHEHQLNKLTDILKSLDSNRLTQYFRDSDSLSPNYPHPWGGSLLRATQMAYFDIPEQQRLYKATEYAKTMGSLIQQGADPFLPRPNEAEGHQPAIMTEFEPVTLAGMIAREQHKERPLFVTPGKILSQYDIWAILSSEDAKVNPIAKFRKEMTDREASFGAVRTNEFTADQLTSAIEGLEHIKATLQSNLASNSVSVDPHIANDLSKAQIAQREAFRAKYEEILAESHPALRATTQAPTTSVDEGTGGADNPKPGLFKRLLGGSNRER